MHWCANSFEIVRLASGDVEGGGGRAELACMIVIHCKLCNVSGKIIPNCFLAAHTDNGNRENRVKLIRSR